MERWEVALFRYWELLDSGVDKVDAITKAIDSVPATSNAFRCPDMVRVRCDLEHCEGGDLMEVVFCERCGAPVEVYERDGEMYGRFALTYPDQHIVCENCMRGDDEPMWEEE